LSRDSHPDCRAAKGNKEAKKPKADKSQPKATISAYKQSQSKVGQATTPFAKKT
jgi:hypothetical protein